MNNKVPVLVLAATVGLTLSTGTATANNMQITNVTLSPGGAGYAFVDVDVSWSNSWRAEWTQSSTTWTNWDAAWVFVKFRTTPGAGFSHASLGTNDSDHVVPAGATLEAAAST